MKYVLTLIIGLALCGCSSNDELPEIPPKRYFTIGEVGELCAVKPHVLRYWEAEFPQLKPVKRRGNRRYYQRGDVILIRQIKSLLYEQGYTIGGARQKMSAKAEPTPAAAISSAELNAIIADLESVAAAL